MKTAAVRLPDYGGLFFREEERAGMGGPRARGETDSAIAIFNLAMYGGILF